MMHPISRRNFIRSMSASAAAVTIPDHLERAENSRASSRPNVIIVFTDDQGYADVGCFGAKNLSTPCLDRMADEGMRFRNFYSVSSVCSPSRAALLTGCYPVRNGVTDVLFPKGPAFTKGRSGMGLSSQEVTIAELLKTCGYATAVIGKWHLGNDRPFLPTNHGFDYYFGLPYSNDMIPENDKEYPDLPLIENEGAVEYNPDQSQLTTRYTEKAVSFIEKNADRPFFLYLAHTMPHVPLAVSDKFKGRSAQGLYGDVVMEIDWSTGRILETLEKLGISGNTLVVFTSDNGPWLAYGNHAGSTGSLREGKMTTFEGGHRVPCIMRWPDRIPEGRISDEIATTMDLFPSIAAMTGAELPRWTIDGKSILPIIEGRPDAASPHDAIYFYDGVELQAVRSGKWKMHLPHRFLTIVHPGMNGARGEEERQDLQLSLFDLEADPGERIDLASKHPDVVRRLIDAAKKFDEEIKSNQRPIGRL